MLAVCVGIQLEEVVAGTNIALACTEVVFSAAFTAGVANWLSLPLEGWVVPFVMVCVFGQKAVWLLIAKLISGAWP